MPPLAFRSGFPRRTDNRPPRPRDFPLPARQRICSADRSPVQCSPDDGRTDPFRDCTHSQLNDDMYCKKCRRLMDSPPAMTRMARAENADLCASYRALGTCTGTCRGRLRTDLASDWTERGRDRGSEMRRNRNGQNEEDVVEAKAQTQTSTAATTATNSVTSLTLKPLTSARLPSQLEKSSIALVRILDDHEVCVQFYRKESGKEFVTDVMRISSDGRDVSPVSFR